MGLYESSWKIQTNCPRLTSHRSRIFLKTFQVPYIIYVVLEIGNEIYKKTEPFFFQYCLTFILHILTYNINNQTHKYIYTSSDTFSLKIFLMNIDKYSIEYVSRLPWPLYVNNYKLLSGKPFHIRSWTCNLNTMFHWSVRTKPIKHGHLMQDESKLQFNMSELSIIISSISCVIDILHNVCFDFVTYTWGTPH